MSLLEHLFNKKKHNQDKEGFPITDHDSFSITKDQVRDLELYQETFFTDKEESEPQDSDEEEYELVEIEILPAKIICPDCGGVTLEGLEFCDKCGGELL